MLVFQFCSYMDSCGLGGEIPSTFANLTNMQTMLRGHHSSNFFFFSHVKRTSQLNIDMLGFQVGIRQSFHWQDTRLHWKLDKTNISVSYQKFLVSSSNAFYVDDKLYFSLDFYAFFQSREVWLL